MGSPIQDKGQQKANDVQLPFSFDYAVGTGEVEHVFHLQDFSEQGLQSGAIHALALAHVRFYDQHVSQRLTWDMVTS